MRQDITSIPVSEVFEQRDGCPVCRLRNTLEHRVVDYITGAAMMESDVRQETNKLGFCFDHYQMMLKKRNRLGVALILESHLEEIEKRVFSKSIIPKSKRKQAKTSTQEGCNCFVCKQVNWAMERMLPTVCRLWETQREFRKLFEEQPAICLTHFSDLSNTALQTMNKKYCSDFINIASQLCKNSLSEIKGDITHFCRMFDYRSSEENKEWGNSKDAIERSIWWLTTRNP